MKTYVLKAAIDNPNQLIVDLLAMEMRANAMGLFPAARAINNAINATGWQIAGNIEKADEAATWRA